MAETKIDSNQVDLSSKQDVLTAGSNISITDNVISADLSGKQDTLVSGTNIKTINNSTILGSGNLTIEGGLPSQTGNAGKFLTTDGTDPSWSDKPYTKDNLVAGDNVTITEGLNNVLLPSQTPVLFHFDGNTTNSGNGSVSWTKTGEYNANAKFGTNSMEADYEHDKYPVFTYDFSSAIFTIEFWFYNGCYFNMRKGMAATPFTVTLGGLDSNNNYTKLKILTNGDQTENLFDITPAPQSSWNHCAITSMGGNSVKFYINGQLITTMTLPIETGSITLYPTGSSGILYDEFVIHNYARYTGSSFSLQSQAYVISETPNTYYQINADLSNKVSSTDVATIVKISQTDYDNLQIKNPTTLYLIESAS